MISSRRRNVIDLSALAIGLLIGLILAALLLPLAKAEAEAGRAQVAELYDAGPVDAAAVDRVVASDHAAPDAGVAAPSAQPHVDPVADPVGWWAEFQALRKKGGPQIAFGFLVAVIAAAVRVRLQPAPGEDEPDPESWRARSLALLGAAAMLGWGVADRAAGAITWSALVPIALAAGALVWRAINPPKGSKSKATTAGA